MMSFDYRQIIGNLHIERAFQPAMEKLFSGQWKVGSIPEKWDGKTAERIITILQSI